MRLEDARKDAYRIKAKREGFRSRAAYKLAELNRTYSLLNPGHKVIDLGCAPGGWLQVASRAVGSSGVVLGVDVRPVDYVDQNVKTLVRDVQVEDTMDILLSHLGGPADLVLSDLSPNISGVWELDHQRQVELTLGVIQAFPRILARGGNAVLKLFEGERINEIRRELKEQFRIVKTAKPKASRSVSSEVYLVCLGFT